jgi:hypothetical protein
MADDQREVLGVHRCSDLASAPLAVGTIPCSSCRHECWIARTSVELIARSPGIAVMCMRCVADDPEGITEVRAVPGSSREISKLLEQPDYRAVRDIISRRGGN